MQQNTHGSGNNDIFKISLLLVGNTETRLLRYYWCNVSQELYAEHIFKKLSKCIVGKILSNVCSIVCYSKMHIGASYCHISKKMTEWLKKGRHIC